MNFLRNGRLNRLNRYFWNGSFAHKEAIEDTVNDGPLVILKKMVKEGNLRYDSFQEETMEQLQTVYKDIKNYDPHRISSLQQHMQHNMQQQHSSSMHFFSSLWNKISFSSSSFGDTVNNMQNLNANANANGHAEYHNIHNPEVMSEENKLIVPKGLYLYGGVGHGKTMMMDMFFRCVPTTKKRRVHFHSFMLDVHARVHQWKMAGGKSHARSDPIIPLAKELMNEAWLLCFDEMQVTDIADAMLIRRLFRMMWAQGCVIVATSNRAPDELYKNGIQRESFLPFISSLKERCRVYEIGSGKDYRLAGRLAKRVYLHPLSAQTTAELDDIFVEITGAPKNMTFERSSIAVMMGRKLDVPKAYKGVAMFHFDDLCRKPLGAADYIAITKKFHTVILNGIPKMTMKDRNECRRFITLIDEFYQSQTKVIFGADADSPKELFQIDDKNMQILDHANHNLAASMLQKQHPESSGFAFAANKVTAAHDEKENESPTTIPKQKLDQMGASLFTGEDEVFAFARTVSRMMEMQTQNYLQAHVHNIDIDHNPK